MSNTTGVQIQTLIAQYFPPELQSALLQYAHSFDNLQEIRCRINQPLCLRYSANQEQCTAETVSSAQMQYMVSRISQGSIYAWEQEFRQGYLTLPGGFRVGLAGKAVLEHGRISTLKQISALNFRIARAIPGAADSFMPMLYRGQNVLNCLIVSPPGGGKTTLLRDIVRQLSNGVPQQKQTGRTVAIVDERSELAGCIHGIPQMDVGCRTDVLDGCPKCEGVRMLIRAMAPQVIAVDEIGTEADVQALEEAAKSGVSVMATAHGASLQDLYKHPVLARLLEGAYFTIVAVLHWQNGQVVPAFYQQNGGAEYEACGCGALDWSRQCNGLLQGV